MPKIAIPAKPGYLRIEESIFQDTPDCDEQIKPGAVRQVPATGGVVQAKGDTAANARFYGVSTRKTSGNLPHTVLRLGVITGLNLANVPFDADIYIDNDGDFNTDPGTVGAASRVGRVIAFKSNLLGQPKIKALSVELIK